MAQGDAKCLKRAEEQWGVITRKEARKHLSASQVQSRLETGAWVRLFPAVYRVRGAPETIEQKRYAVHCWSDAVFSHRAAAALHGLKGFERCEVLEVTSATRLTPQPGVTAHRGAIRQADIVLLDSGLRVTSVKRTLVDLSALVSATELKDAVQGALRKKATTLEALEQAATRAGRRPGAARLRAVLAELQGQGGPTESELEEAALELVAMANLPRPRVQRPVKVGGRRARLDLIFEPQGVVIECDGYATHSDAKSFETDRARNNRLTAHGYRVLHWTWSGIHDRAEELVLDLAYTLAR